MSRTPNFFLRLHESLAGRCRPLGVDIDHFEYHWLNVTLEPCTLKSHIHTLSHTETFSVFWGRLPEHNDQGLVTILQTTDSSR